MLTETPAAAGAKAAGFTGGSPRRTRLLIFVTALSFRLTAAAVFFGSVDTLNLVTNSIALAQGKSVALPYFPTVNALIWLGGVLAAYTPLPLPLCLKLVPILFDSLLAVLIRDLTAGAGPRFAFRAGLLYAFCPVALLINGFHGQWDSIALFFLLLAFAVRSHDGRKQFLFGAVFGLGLLVKPIALPFLLLLPRRKGEKTSSELAAAIGIAPVFVVAFSIYVACGYSVLDLLIGITSYSAKGVQVFGLPFAPGLAKLAIQNYRLLWVIPAMIFLAVQYHRRRFNAIETMLLFYLFTLATTGLSPQYLLWPLPLLLVSRRMGLAALYTAVAMLFLLFYYMNPWASYFPFENMKMFAPLRGLAWLLPPAAMAARGLLPWVHALGNIVFPTCAGGIAFAVFRRRNGADLEGRLTIGKTAGYLAPSVVVAAITLLLRTAVAIPHVRARLLEISDTIPVRYAVHVYAVKATSYLVGDFGSFTPFNAAVLLALLTAIWCAAARLASTKSQAEDPAEGPIRR